MRNTDSSMGATGIGVFRDCFVPSGTGIRSFVADSVPNTGVEFWMGFASFGRILPV